MFEIRLENLEMYGHIGISEQERLVGNNFKVDVMVSYDADEFETEDLNTTISYAEVYDIIVAQMGRTWKLLESVCQNISAAIIGKWKNVLYCEVKLTKLSVPLNGFNGTASVKYIYEDLPE